MTHKEKYIDFLKYLKKQTDDCACLIYRYQIYPDVTFDITDITDPYFESTFDDHRIRVYLFRDFSEFLDECEYEEEKESLFERTLKDLRTNTGIIWFDENGGFSDLYRENELLKEELKYAREELQK